MINRTHTLPVVRQCQLLRANKGVGSLFRIDLKEQQAIGVSIARGRPEPMEALEEMASTMSLLGIEFYKSPAIIVHDPGDEARFVSNNGF